MDRNKQQALADMENLILNQPTEPSDMGNTPKVEEVTHHPHHDHDHTGVTAVIPILLKNLPIWKY